MIQTILRLPHLDSCFLAFLYAPKKRQRARTELPFSTTPQFLELHPECPALQHKSCTSLYLHRPGSKLKSTWLKTSLLLDLLPSRSGSRRELALPASAVSGPQFNIMSPVNISENIELLLFCQTHRHHNLKIQTTIATSHTIP